MPSPQKRPALAGATRRGHYRQVSGVPVDAITAAGVGGTTTTDHGITELTGDVTAGPGDGSQAATIGANKVTTGKILDANVTSAKLRDSAALSVIGRSANSIGVPADIAAGVNGYVLQRLANVLGFSALDISAITDGAITLAKLADLANQRLIGRNTAGSGVPEAVTLTQLLDWISGSVTKGDILVRDTSSWIRLAAPAIGNFLGGNGTGAVPSYQPTNGASSPLANKHHFEAYVANGGSLNFTGGAGITGTISGTTNALPAAAFADGWFWRAASSTTAATSGAYAGTTTGGGPLNWTWDFDLTMIMRTDISAITGCRYWLGVLSGAPGNTDTLPTSGIGFRFSTVAGDGGWVGVANDGTQSVSGTVASIAANTRYVLRIRRVGSTVFFSVNGGAETSLATHVPTTDTYRYISMAVYNTAGGAGSDRSLYFSRLWCDYAS